MKRVVAMMVLLLAGSAFGQVIRAHSIVSASATQPVVTIDEPYSYPKIILAMGAVIGVIFALKWGAGKLMPGTVVRSGRSMSVLSRLAIGPRQQLMLVKVGRRAVLLANSSSQTNCLCEITDADELAHLIGQVEGEKGAVPARGAFASFFKKREEEFEPTRQDVSLESGRVSHESAELGPEDDRLVGAACDELSGLAKRVRALSKNLGVNC